MKRWSIEYVEPEPSADAFADCVIVRKAQGPRDVSGKLCGRCEAWKPREAFLRNPRTRTGLGSFCGPCRLATSRGDRGVHPDDVDTPLGPNCEICGGNGIESKLVLDHDHHTGRMRGTLCGLCNTMLGMARDDEVRLASAISYLSRSRP